MKCTYTWLKEFVDFDFSAAELAEQLTMLGLEVDSFSEIKHDFHDAIIGKIEEKIDDQHFKVTIGKEIVTATSSESQLSANQPVVIFRRNVGSKQYSIASYQALGISDDPAIIYIEENIPLSKKIAEIIPEIDVVYDIDITTNRPDCLSIIGIAREIATCTGNPLRIPDVSLIEAKLPAAAKIQIKILTPNGCPRYGARIIQDLTIHPSPIWMHDRLVKVGLRAINNVVDVTNYVLIELGHPLHAFDYNLLLDHQIQVRLSEHGERFVTLDGKGYTLDDNTVLICDAKRPVAIGGIMGGLNSEVKNSTQAVLLECAYFNPSHIRKSSGKLGLTTDSSMRFCRGVDPNGVVFIINRAAQLMQLTAQGSILQGVVDEYVQPIEPTKITLRTERVHNVLGTTIAAGQIKQILSRLGNTVVEQNRVPDKSATIKKSEQDSVIFQVIAPTFRPDLTREIDLIEEIARVTGYEVIPEKVSTSFVFNSRVNWRERFLCLSKDYWIGNGFYEVVGNSMIPLSDISLKFYAEETIQLLNPLSEDMAVLRPSLIPSLLRQTQYNLFRQQETIRLFEIGNIFQQQNQTHQEDLSLGGMLTGFALPTHWEHKNRSIDFYDLKGLLFGFCQWFRIVNLKIKTGSHWALEAPGVNLEVNGIEIGSAGKIKKEILAQYDIPSECLIFELNLRKLFPNITWDRQYQPIPRFPSVRRDLAFLLDFEITGDVLEKEIKRWGGTFLKSLNIFDVYIGKQVPIGKKSVAVSLIFQAEERTLVESEINQIVGRIISELKRSINAELRS